MSLKYDTSPTEQDQPAQIHHPRFAAFYEWYARLGQPRRLLDPLREETAGQASGVVLEVGAGTGLNFALYRPERVERVEATEPDRAMLAYARERARAAAVPITLTQASVSALPFADATFDSVVVTLVFCSVPNPLQGLEELKRVLKPEGTFFMVEHVRSERAWVGRLQDALVPVTTRLFGNCHWNRDTARMVQEAGWVITQLRRVQGGPNLHIVLQARRPEA